MNKSDLVGSIAADTGLPKARATTVLDAILVAVVQSVSKGDAVTLVGFGTFKASKRAARSGINPQTKTPIAIAATVLPRFVAGSGFKSAVASAKGKR